MSVLLRDRCPEWSIESATHNKGNVLRNCDVGGVWGVLGPRIGGESCVYLD